MNSCTCFCVAQAWALASSGSTYRSYRKLRRSFMQPIQLLMLRIQRSDGRNRLGNWYHCCIQVKCPSGTLVEYDLQVPHSRLSEVVQVVQNLSLISSSLQLNSLRQHLDENLAPLNATIFAARLLKSSSSEESDEAPLSASVT